MVPGHFPAFPVISQLLGEALTAQLCSSLLAGLALEKYTHFTSPIRRYADIIVHRLLMAATLRGTTGDVKDNIISNKDLEELCRHINNRNRVRASFWESPWCPREWDTTPDRGFCELGICSALGFF